MLTLEVSPALGDLIRPQWFEIGGIVARERDPRLDEPLRTAAEALRKRGVPEDVTAAVRAMYRRVGIDPTKTRPSSEALWRRIQKGDALPRINSAVDVINWCSVETALPFGLYDRAAIDGDVVLRLGEAGEGYAGIRKDMVHVAGRPTLSDRLGPFGNPTSDSARTMVTGSTTDLLVLIYAPAAVAVDLARRAAERTRERLEAYARPASS